MLKTYSTGTGRRQGFLNLLSLDQQAGILTTTLTDRVSSSSGYSLCKCSVFKFNPRQTIAVK